MTFTTLLVFMTTLVVAQPWLLQSGAGPFATMSEKTVTLHPSNATFQIPDEVFSDSRTKAFTRYLTRAELERVKTVPAPEWDHPYSRILNAALPFEACAVHVGTEPFGAGGRTFGDLHVRVYVLDGPAAVVRDAIGRDGLAEARRAFAPATAQFPGPELTNPPSGTPWSLTRIAYLRHQSDFAAGVNLDFYVREFGNQTVVVAIVAMRTTRRSSWDPAVAKIIESFTWPK